MNAPFQHGDTAAAEVGMLHVLADIAFVVPAALTFDAASSGDFDQGVVVLLTGKDLRPGFTPKLQLGHQQPVA